MRRLFVVIAVALGLSLTAFGAPATAGGYWACVAVDHIDLGACVKDPVPDPMPRPLELVPDLPI